MTTPDIVLLHGWLMGPELWDGQSAALAAAGRTLAVSQPGHGAPGLADEPTMAGWAERLLRLLAGEEIDRAVFVGHSMGGMLALEVARSHPEKVAGLVLISTTARVWPAEQRQRFTDLVDLCADGWSRDLAATVAGLLMGQRFLDRHPAWLDAWSDRVATSYDRAAIARLGRAVAGHPDYGSTAAGLEVPVLVIHGTDDQAIPIDHGRALAARIPGATLVELAGCGHAPPMEDPDRVGEALAGYVTDLVTGSPGTR